MTGRRNTDFQSADILSAVPSAGYKPAGRTGHKACVPGSIRVWRVSFGASPKQSRVHGKVRDRDSAIAPSRTGDSTRAHAFPEKKRAATMVTATAVTIRAPCRGSDQ